MITAVSLTELADQAFKAAFSISQHLHSKSLDQPNFSPTYAGLPEDAEIEDARQSLLVASKALTALATNPLAHLREVCFGVCTPEEIVEWFYPLYV